jgi:hypothetical protein
VPQAVHALRQALLAEGIVGLGIELHAQCQCREPFAGTQAAPGVLLDHAAEFCDVGQFHRQGRLRFGLAYRLAAIAFGGVRTKDSHRQLRADASTELRRVWGWLRRMLNFSP